MNIKSKLKTNKSLLLILTILLLHLNILQFYLLYKEKQQTKDNFFIQSRISRDQNASKIFPTYKTIIDDKNTSPEARAAIEKKFQESANNLNMEQKLETLLKGKSFDDSFVQLLNGRAVVFVKDNSKSLEPNRLKDVQDTVFELTNIKDVEIVEKK